MATIASTIEAKFTADISDLSTKMDIISGQMAKVQTSTANTAKGFILGGVALQGLNIAFNAAKGFIESGIQDYIKLNDQMTRFNVLAANTKSGLQAYSDVLNKQVNNALKNTVYSHEQVISAMSQFAKYGIDASKAGQMLEVAENAAAGTGIDLDTVITALQRSAQGLTSRGLVQLGVNMNEVKASGNKLSDVLKQLGKYSGDAEAMTKTLSGQMTQLNNNLTEVKTNIAAQFVPAINSALSSMLGLTSGMVDDQTAQNNIQKVTYQTIEGFKAFWDILNMVVDGILTLGTALAAIPSISVAVIVDIVKDWKQLPDLFKAIGDNIGLSIKHGLTGAAVEYEKLPDMAFTATTQTSKFFKDMVSGLAIETGESFNKLGEDMAGMLDGTGFKTTALGNNIQKMAGDGIDAIDGLTNSLKKTKDEMMNFVTGIDDAASKHQEAIDKIKADIDSLNKDYAQSDIDAKSSHLDNVANIVKQHEDKVKELKKQLMEESAFGQSIDEQKIADTQTQLAQEMAFLNKHASDVASVQTQLSQDELDKEDSKYAEEETKRKSEYDKKLADLNTQLSKENDSYNQSLAKMVIDFKGNWEEILKYIKTTATPNIIAAFDDMVKQANAKLTGIGLPALSIPASAIPGKRQKQTGGMITETGIHLLHAGEQVIPRSQVEAGKGIKGNISVNFYGGMTLTKEADEDRLANKIRNVMMQDQHLAQSGLY